jgi:hypothetical protein
MFNGDLIWGVSWIWYLLGLLGVGGTIAFFVLDTAGATLFFKWLISFLWKTRIGWALVAGFLAFEIADIHRSKLDEAAFAARTAEFEQKQKERDAKIEADTRAAVLTELAQNKTDDTATDKDVKEFQNEHPAPATPAATDNCRIGPDVDQLRRISGTPIGRPGSAQAVSKAGKAGATTGHRGRFKLPKFGSGSTRTTQ